MDFEEAISNEFTSPTNIDVFKEIGTISFKSRTYNSKLAKQMPFSEANLDLDSVNYELNCIVYPKYCLLLFISHMCNLGLCNLLQSCFDILVCK